MAVAASCKWNGVSSNETGTRHASDLSPYTFISFINDIVVYKTPSLSLRLCDEDVCVCGGGDRKGSVSEWPLESPPVEWPVVVRPVLSSKVRPHFKIRKIHGKNKYLVVGPRGTRNQDWLCWIGSGRVNCCWSSPVQWSLVLSPAGLMTIFYCLTATPRHAGSGRVGSGRVNCCWFSPVQWSLVRSPVEFTVRIYCLTTLTVLARTSSN
jgi:hypothetical protein